jgi:hypothetical protein
MYVREFELGAPGDDSALVSLELSTRPDPDTLLGACH